MPNNSKEELFLLSYMYPENFSGLTYKVLSPHRRYAIQAINIMHFNSIFISSSDSKLGCEKKMITSGV